MRPPQTEQISLSSTQHKDGLEPTTLLIRSQLKLLETLTPSAWFIMQMLSSLELIHKVFFY